MTNLAQPDAKVMSLYHEEIAEDYYEKDSGISGFGEAARMTEGAIITSESQVQTFDQTYTQVFFGKMAQFTLYDYKFGIKRRKLESTIRDLDGSVRRLRARLLTDYLENSIGATTSYTVSDDSGNYSKSVTGGDGVALINSSHTREDGGSAWSNVVSDGSNNNIAFGPAGIEAAYRTASLIVDPKGNLMDVNLDKLVVRKGSQAYFDAVEINGALGRNHAPNSAEYNGAPYGQFEIVDLPYLSTSASAYWWMCDSSLMGPEYGLQYRESQDITLDSPHVDYKTKTIYVTAHAAFDYGHNDGRSWVGSDGTGS